MKFSDLKVGMILTKSQPDDTRAYKNVNEVQVMALDDPYLDVMILSTTDNHSHLIGTIDSMRGSLQNFEIKTNDNYEIF